MKGCQLGEWLSAALRASYRSPQEPQSQQFSHGCRFHPCVHLALLPMDTVIMGAFMVVTDRQ